MTYKEFLIPGLKNLQNSTKFHGFRLCRNIRNSNGFEPKSPECLQKPMNLKGSGPYGFGPDSEDS